MTEEIFQLVKSELIKVEKNHSLLKSHLEIIDVFNRSEMKMILKDNGFNCMVSDGLFLNIVLMNFLTNFIYHIVDPDFI